MTAARTRGSARRPLAVLSVLVAVAAVASRAAGQSELAPPPAPKLPVVGDWTIQASLEAEYDSNVFRLSDDSISRLRSDDPDDKVSGRFDDMNSPEDVFVTAEVALRRRFTDTSGDDFRLLPGVRYLQYFNNPRKSHPEFFIDLRQELAPGSALGFDVEYRRDVFVGNYLSDVVDLTGSVSDDERRYDPGLYDQWTGTFSLEQRLWRRSKESWPLWRTLGVRRLDLDADVGFARRWYYAPFSNRDLDRVSADLRLTAQVATDWEVGVGYGFDADRTDHGDEVMIRDEDDFDADFNGDGDRVDQNVRAVEAVDRSRNQQTIEARLTWEFATHWRAGVRGIWEVQDYLSDEPVDTAHRDRVDRSREIRIDVRWAFQSGSDFFVTAGLSRERSNRDAATTLEDQDVAYRDRYVGVGVKVRF